jgi:hypothetical protein
VRVEGCCETLNRFSLNVHEGNTQSIAEPHDETTIISSKLPISLQASESHDDALDFGYSKPVVGLIMLDTPPNAAPPTPNETFGCASTAVGSATEVCWIEHIKKTIKFPFTTYDCDATCRSIKTAMVWKASIDIFARVHV